MVPEVLLVQLKIFKADLAIRKLKHACSNLGGIGERLEAGERDLLRGSCSISQEQRDRHRPDRRQRHKRISHAGQRPVFLLLSVWVVAGTGRKKQKDGAPEQVTSPPDLSRDRPLPTAHGNS